MIDDDHRYRVDLPAAEVVVQADGARMQQVLLNLLMNAIVHAPETPEIAIRLRTIGGRAETAVEDRGPGIPEDVRASLFSRFEPGRSGGGRGGLGLGLFLSREIVTAHGGTIECESEVGRGTTFIIRLPLFPAAPR
jgi:two-component system OmpR family sensor kinase